MNFFSLKIANFSLIVFCLINFSLSFDPDLITNLTGLNFQINFNQYSGYLNASNDRYQHYLHYWLVESQNDPKSDPVILWLNGGPACSSLGGFMEELGPFHPNQDGKTLFENIFAWNKVANVIFLEQPTGVGFSYSVDGNDTTTDEQVRDDMFRALTYFYEIKFPRFKTNQFFISGESYAGIYIPMLASKIVDEIANNNFPVKLTGIAIGNGYYSQKWDSRSLLHYAYYHGIIGIEDWNNLLQICCGSEKNSSEDCDFSKNIINIPIDGGNYDSDGTPCGDLVLKHTIDWISSTSVDTYNIYQDCYENDESNFFQKSKKISNEKRKKFRFRRRSTKFGQKMTKFFDSLEKSEEDTARKINYESSDPFAAFPCWNDFASDDYLNISQVKQDLHVADSILGETFYDCSDIPYYSTQPEMGPFFENIIQKSDTRILIYNGDADTECNFLSAEWFVRLELQKNPQNQIQKIGSRSQWTYRNQIAGYWEHFKTSKSTLYLLTVKGAGHFVPADRPGPALQMISSFLRSCSDYDTPFDQQSNKCTATRKKSN